MPEHDKKAWHLTIQSPTSRKHTRSLLKGQAALCVEEIISSLAIHVADY
jgi:hypothetical protein